MKSSRAKMLYIILLTTIVPQCVYGDIDLDAGIKAAPQIADFVLRMPTLISDIIDFADFIPSTVKALTNNAQELKTAFSPTAPNGLPKLLEQTLTAYGKKDYDQLGFGKIGIALETQVPQIMALMLEIYPFINFTANKIGRPVLSLTRDIGATLGNSFVKNFSNDMLEILNSGVLEQTFTLINELDTLVSYDLMPRITDLLTDIDDLMPHMKNLGLIK